MLIVAYCDQVKSYHEIAMNVPLLCEHTVSTGLYEMHRHELIETMVESASSFRDQVLSQMTHDYQSICKQ